jgi:hypothetical protein
MKFRYLAISVRLSGHHPYFIFGGGSIQKSIIFEFGQINNENGGIQQLKTNILSLGNH